METEKTLAELGNRLDTWFADSLASLAGGDAIAQSGALSNGVHLLKELDQIKHESLARFRDLLYRSDWPDDEHRIAAFVRGFEFGARLKHALSDEFMDTATYNQITLQLSAILSALDGVGSGRRLALLPLLDHSDARVRVTAAVSLLKLVPDRAVPILREIEAKEQGNSAHFAASFTLFRREHDGK